MTKAEYIERYGLERYEQYKARNNARTKNYYHNNPEYKKSQKIYSKERYRNDPEYRKSIIAHKMEHYNNDLEFRESTRVRNNARNKERYRNDPEFRESIINRTKSYHKEHYNKDSEFRESRKIYNKTRYVKNGRIDLIENYEIAAKDNFEYWEIHHRLELHPDGSVRFTMQSLIKLDLYYDRPPSELIWLKCSEHRQIHNKARRSN